jgi:drug/metabolite transporter (DMT)-like permease
MPPPEVIAAVAGLGIVCTALAFLLFFQLVAEVGPVRANVVTYLNPAVAVLAGVGLLGEPFTTQAAAGLVLILGGSWLATGARGADQRHVAVAPSRADDPPRSSAGWKAAGCE